MLSNLEFIYLVAVSILAVTFICLYIRKRNEVIELVKQLFIIEAYIEKIKGGK